MTSSNSSNATTTVTVTSDYDWVIYETKDLKKFIDVVNAGALFPDYEIVQFVTGPTLATGGGQVAAISVIMRRLKKK